jgi:hypothetical protein
MAVEGTAFGDILSGSFDWNAGKLVHKDVKLIQSEYLNRATQIGGEVRHETLSIVTRRVTIHKVLDRTERNIRSTSKKTMGACLQGSGADWIPDPVHGRENKGRDKQDRDFG